MATPHHVYARRTSAAADPTPAQLLFDLFCVVVLAVILFAAGYARCWWTMSAVVEQQQRTINAMYEQPLATRADAEPPCELTLPTQAAETRGGN